MNFRYEFFHEIETISEDQIESIRDPIFEGVKNSKNCPFSILCAKTASMHCTQSLVLHITYVHKKNQSCVFFLRFYFRVQKTLNFLSDCFFFIAKKPMTILIIFHARAYYTYTFIKNRFISTLLQLQRTKIHQIKIGIIALFFVSISY